MFKISTLRQTKNMSKRKPVKRKKPLKQLLIGDRTLTLEEWLKESGMFPKGPPKLVESIEEKMSDILLAFASPLLTGTENIPELDRIVGFAMAVWNISMNQKMDRAVAIPAIAGIFLPDTGKGITDTLSLIRTLLQRKNDYFSHVKKYIIDYEISLKNGEPSLKVIWAPFPSKT